MAQSYLTFPEVYLDPKKKPQAVTKSELAETSDIASGYAQGPLSATLSGAASGALSTLGTLVGLPGGAVNLALGTDYFMGPQRATSGLISAYNKMLQSGAAGLEAAGISEGGTKAKYATSDIKEIPSALRPLYQAGNVTGSALVPSGVLNLLARATPAAKALVASATPSRTAVGSAYNQLMKEAVTNPAFRTVGRGAGAGAALAAGATEVVAPDSPIAQLVGQTVGGLAGGTLAGSALGGLSASAARARQLAAPVVGRGENADIQAAGQSVARAFKSSGESLPEVRAAVEGMRPDSMLLPAQAAKSKTLVGIQDFLASKDPDLANLISRNKEEIDIASREALKAGFAPGAVDDLTKAASATSKAFDTWIDNKISKATSAAQASAEQAAALPAAARTQLNVRAKELVQSAYADLRKMESSLYRRVNKRILIPPDNFNNAVASVRSEMLREESFFPELDGFTRRMKKVAEDMLDPESEVLGVPFKEMGRIRTLIGRETAAARAAGKPDLVRELTKISEGALDDMSTVSDPAAVIARDFSRKLNDKITRTYAGDVLGVKPTGAERIPQESTLERAVVAGRPQETVSRMQQLGAAMEPIRLRAETAQSELPQFLRRMEEMQATQNQFIRSLGRDIFDDGRIKVPQAESFVRKNEAILDAFPEYKQDLLGAIASQKKANMVEAALGGVVKQKERAAFSKIIGAKENPSVAIQKAIQGNSPEKDFYKIATLARNAGEDATAGLRAAVMEYINRASNGKWGVMDDLLTRRVSERETAPSLLGMMERTRVVSKDQSAKIMQTIKQGVESDLSQITGIEVKEFGALSGALSRALSRWFGAKLSSVSGLGSGNAGTGLQAAQQAANLVERFTSKMPADRVNAIMARALSERDPDLMIRVLEAAASSMPKSTLRSEAQDAARALRQQFNILMARFGTAQAGLGGD